MTCLALVNKDAIEPRFASLCGVTLGRAGDEARQLAALQEVNETALCSTPPPLTVTITHATLASRLDAVLSLLPHPSGAQ